jgi:arginyl-tRNA synthetase
VITRDLRDAIARAAAAAGFAPADPGLRPGGRPGRYASSVAFELGKDPRETAGHLAPLLTREPWIARADVTGPGYLTITVTPEALTSVGDRIAQAGPDSARSEALRGVTLQAQPAADLLAAATWEEARAALAAELTARLAVAAGATVIAPGHPERRREPPPAGSHPAAGASATFRSEEERGKAAAIGESYGAAARGTAAGERSAAGERDGRPVAAAVAFAGLDTVRFSLARAVPGRPVRIDPAKIARYVPDNPAYAVRYAHARAASGVRWAAASRGPEAAPRCPPADPGELALLDALSWLPERVATAARRGRPDEFARYLEQLASVTIATLSGASHPGSARAPGTGKLTVARAAQTGLAAGLELLGVSAPDRL